MIIDIISDLHGAKPKLDGGDLLIIAGDLTRSDKEDQYWEFNKWLKQQSYKKIIIIAGNHDNELVHTKDKLMAHVYCHPGEYLCDSGTEIVHYPPLTKDMPDGSIVYRQKFKIWGSPWSAWFDGMNPRCMAFTRKTDKELAEKWALIPDDTDILITHTPPYGILDEAMQTHNYQSVGSKSLLARVHKIRPKLHIYGHIHEGYGQYKADGVHFINASIMDVNYKPSNKPVRVEL